MFLVSCFPHTSNHYYLHTPYDTVFYQSYKRMKALTSFQYKGTGPNRLMYIDVPVLDETGCSNYLNAFDATRMICAGYLDVSFKQRCQ